ncbi:MAG: hypothetical protein NT076_00170, partial [Candidatus Pacearchaeota archaeon]|nr:hypothetical protein [Candidatus Pacearchaeota archaeon]
MVKNQKEEVQEQVIETKENKQSELISKMRANPWIVSTAVFALATIILLVLSISPSLTGNAISSSSASTKLVDFLNGKVGGGVTLVNTTSLGSFYEVTVLYQGNEIPVYISKDGKYYSASVAPISTTATPTTDTQQPAAEVPKTDKPAADFYVFAYCPYGTQMEKALIPAYNLLKNKADINIVFIGAMHGEYEHVESLRQLCIQKNYGKDKLFAYLDKFLGNAAIGTCQGTDTCVNPLIETIFSQLSIDKNKI